jgi:FkbM family methyltransferase
LKKIIKLFNIVSNPTYIHALLSGTAAGTEHTRLLLNLECNYVVDIGANRGQFALAARQSFPQATIISFEPLKEPAILFRRVFRSDPNVKLHEFAIGMDEEDLIIYVTEDDDSSSLLPTTPLQNNLFPGTFPKEERSVQVKPLDAVLDAEEIQSPALLKLDVQGYELRALEGCRSLLPLFSYIYVECSFVELYVGQSLAHEVISFLQEYGFIVSGVYNLYYDKQGAAIQGDFLFKKKVIA